MTPKFHALVIADVRRETEDTVSIAFGVPESLKSDYAYKSGQYLTLKAIINGQDTRRSYSLCSSPFENEWRVAVKRVENGVFSNFANDALKIGDSIEVMTPTGNFALTPNQNTSKNYALFAAGSGVTPILSIAKTVLKEEPNSSVTFFYGNKNFGSIIFREEIEALKNNYMDRLRVIHVLSRESLGNQIQKGRIDKANFTEIIKSDLNILKADAFFICGPEGMIHDVKDTLKLFGVHDKKIKFELFAAPIASEQIPEIDFKGISEVTVILDHEKLTFEMKSGNATILDLVEKNGMDAPYSCRGGVCCSCKAKVLEGKATMRVNYSLTDEEVKQGYILTCQAQPNSEKLTVSFDE
jgi:ring-1,2-phenylacetyl-CoA epoxidase subunit PaaE